jgi:hypothetical protein
VSGFIYGFLNSRVKFNFRFGQSPLHIGKECPFNFRVGFGIQRDSVLKPGFESTILMIEEAGLITKWKQDSLDAAAKLDESRAQIQEAKPWGLDDLQASFIFLAIFVVITLLVFIVEFGLGQCKGKRI